MTKEISRTTEVKKSGKYVAEHTITDEKEVYEELALAMISKKINNCSWIKSIKRTPLYNGTQKITITFDNGCRNIYIVADH